MTFERIEALWALTLLLPIALLHLRFRRRRRVQVSSLAPWRAVSGSRAGRRGLQRLRDALALLFVALAVGALSLALAGPVTGEPAAPSGRLVIVLDASVTTNATADDGAPRFERLRAAAREALLRLGPGDDVTLFVDDGAPYVAAPPTTSREHALAALGRAHTSLRKGTLGHALDLAEAAVRLRPPAETDALVLTDAIGAAALAQRERARGRSGAGAPPWTEHVGVVAGDGRGNAAIAELTRDAEDRRRLQVLVRTTDGPPLDRTLATFFGTTLIEETPVRFSEGGDTLVTLPLPAVSETRELTLRLLPDDAFGPDDEAALEVRPRRAWRVGVLARDARPSPFLVEALRVLPERVDPARTVLLRPDPPAAAFADLDAVVLDGVRPEGLPEGLPWIAFLAPPQRGAERPGESAVSRPLLWSLGAHPVLAGVDLSPLRIDRAMVLDARPGDVPLIGSAAGTVALAREGAGGGARGVRGVLLGFRPDATTLPLEAGFPVLVRNALDWIGRPPLLPPVVRAGEPLLPRLPPGAEGARVVVKGPGDVRADVRIGDDGALAYRVPEPPVRGPYALELIGPGGTATTCVHWTGGVDFHVDPPQPLAPSGARSAEEAVLDLPDRRENRDTRERLAPQLALLGAGLLALGAVLLARR